MTRSPDRRWEADGRQAGSRSQHLEERAALLTDDVYATLRAMLQQRELPPGARINLEALARRLSCSNTPVRRALERLETEGLVTKEPFRGFIASPLLDARVIAEIYDTRMLLEPVFAARAAQRGIERTSRALASLCDPAAIDALLVGPQEHELQRRDVAFHLTIAEQAGNAVSVETLRTVLARGIPYSLYSSNELARLAWDEHRAIVTSVEAGDPGGAAEAMRTHLRHGLQSYRDAIA